uniref:hypothetical protein n=1 Tax=Trichocoleus desertorum TaxID=1481672 RepID=UPI0025B5B31D|nr:hypothetical protein [Trichocoleus desertorum]
MKIRKFSVFGWRGDRYPQASILRKLRILNGRSLYLTGIGDEGAIATKDYDQFPLGVINDRTSKGCNRNWPLGLCGWVHTRREVPTKRHPQERWLWGRGGYGPVYGDRRYSHVSKR